MLWQTGPYLVGDSTTLAQQQGYDRQRMNMVQRAMDKVANIVSHSVFAHIHFDCKNRRGFLQ